MAEPGPESLADALAVSGELRSSPWREAFAAVPRHRFVPRYFALHEGRWRAVADGDPDHLVRVYRERGDRHRA